MSVPRFPLWFAVVLLLSACASTSRAPDDPPIVGLAEAQAFETLEGSTGDPADVQGENAAGAVEIAAGPSERRGLFGLFGGGGTANATGSTPGVARGGTLPFAQVANVCGASPRSLGTEVDEAPKAGRSRFELIDSVPNSTAARTQYITGFSDRCARQFTGALVLFGSSAVHEATRYAQSNRRPYTATDDAYEQLKSRICGVRRNVPCPADRRDRLDRAVVFVTIYPSFGSGDQWFELLLSDGQLQAQALTGV